MYQKQDVPEELGGPGVDMDAHESGYKRIGRNVKRRGRDSTEEYGNRGKCKKITK